MYDDEALVKYEEQQDVKNGISRSDEQVRTIVKEKMMGTALLKRSDMNRYTPLLIDIRDQYGFGSDVYPKTLAAGHDMLEDYASSRKLHTKKKKAKVPPKNPGTSRESWSKTRE